jgi:hypothetical protein
MVICTILGASMVVINQRGEGEKGIVYMLDLECALCFSKYSLVDRRKLNGKG